MGSPSLIEISIRGGQKSIESNKIGPISFYPIFKGCSIQFSSFFFKIEFIGLVSDSLSRTKNQTRNSAERSPIIIAKTVWSPGWRGIWHIRGAAG